MSAPARALNRDVEPDAGDISSAPASLGVFPEAGLSTAEAGSRLAAHGPHAIFNRGVTPSAVHLRYGRSALAMAVTTGPGPLQRMFGTTSVTFGLSCMYFGLAASLVVVEELIKWVLQHRGAVGPPLAPPALAHALPASA